MKERVEVSQNKKNKKVVFESCNEKKEAGTRVGLGHVFTGFSMK